MHFDDRDLIMLIVVAIITGVVLVLGNDEERTLDTVVIASALYGLYRIGRNSP